MDLKSSLVPLKPLTSTYHEQRRPFVLPTSKYLVDSDWDNNEPIWVNGKLAQRRVEE